MRILGRDKLVSFMSKHARSRGPLKAWLAEAEQAEWTKWADIKARYPSADLITEATKSAKAGPDTGRVVVFNIKGNNFRLVVKVYFSRSMVLIERVGTHAQYNKWKL